MRSRTILMILFSVIVAVFVALNWAELSRNVTLNLGMSQTQGPLGLIMLGLLLIAAVLFLGYAVAIQTGAMMEAHSHNKELKAQRELAENAEASRFTELRSLIDKIEADSHTRQNELRNWFGQRLSALQGEVNTTVENSGNTLAAYMGELEDRIQAHFGHPTDESRPPRAIPATLPPATAAAPADGADAPAASDTPATGSSLGNFARKLFAGNKPPADPTRPDAPPPPPTI